MTQTTPDIPALIEAVLASPPGDARRPFRRALADLGSEALPSIVDATRGLDRRKTNVLVDTIELMRDPTMGPLVIPLLDHRSFRMKAAATILLAGLREPGAARAIAERLPLLPYAPAVSALGDIGDPVGLPALEELFAGVFGDDPDPVVLNARCRAVSADRVDLGLIAGESMAKLGVLRAAPTLQSLALLGRDELVRVAAIRTITGVLGPGTLACLGSTAVSDNPRVRLASVRTLRSIATTETAAILVGRADDEDSSVAMEAIGALHDLTGRWWDPKVAPLGTTGWPEALGPSLPAHLAFRDGAPLDVGGLVERLATQPRDEGLTFELRLLTGARLGADDFFRDRTGDQILLEARGWWTENAARFPAGGLYRHGYRLDAAVI